MITVINKVCVSYASWVGSLYVASLSERVLDFVKMLLDVVEGLINLPSSQRRIISAIVRGAPDGKEHLDKLLQRCHIWRGRRIW